MNCGGPVSGGSLASVTDVASFLGCLVIDKYRGSMLGSHIFRKLRYSWSLKTPNLGKRRDGLQGSDHNAAPIENRIFKFRRFQYTSLDPKSYAVCKHSTLATFKPYVYN